MTSKARTINDIAAMAYDLEQRKGFHTAEKGGDRNLGEQLMLIVTELSELLEADRKGILHVQTEKPVPLTNGEEEVADFLLRGLGLAARLGYDVERIVNVKHTYNEGRPPKHGKRY